MEASAKELYDYYSELICDEEDEYEYRCNNFCFGCVGGYDIYACTDCTDCFFCYNLKNKKYCICNIQLTKEEYKKKRKAIIGFVVPKR